MRKLRFLTAGESHGPGLVGILEGLPAGLPLEAPTIDKELARRQLGYGRGGRMKIEKDRARILGGVRLGRTLGSPLGLFIENLDHENWRDRMAVEPGAPDPNPVRVPRPGHADLAGGLKYGHTGDLRNVLERASARETAMRVALGAAAKALLREFGITVGSYVRRIGEAEGLSAEEAAPELARGDAAGLARLADSFRTRALDADSDGRMAAAIEEAMRRKDTLGGVVEVVATGLFPGLGSHVHYDLRLDARLSQALLSIPAIKAISLGAGWENGAAFGSEAHDPIVLEGNRLQRLSNRAGGLEGGMTNGEPLVARVAMKPLSTVPKPLPSVHLGEVRPHQAHVERTDICAVPAAGVVAEAMVALVLADALLESTGGERLEAMRLPAARMRLSSRSRLGHVFLLGPPGAGKSSAGLILAEKLGLPFIDLDARIEARAEASIRSLFQTLGEPGFRALEAEALAEVCAKSPAVVALGGGAVTREAAWRLLWDKGVTVLLQAPVEVIARRLSRAEIESRPLLAGGDPVERLAQIVAERLAWFERADLRIDTTGLSAEQVAGAIVGLLRQVEGPMVPRVGGAGRERP